MDAVAFAIAIEKAKVYTDKKIVSGSTDKGTWDASTNTPTLVQGVGTDGWYYHVSKAGIWDSTSFNIADTILFDSSKKKWVKINTGNEYADYPMIVKYVKEGDSFPTTRQSGSALVTGDTCCVDAAATLPFTIGSITFDSYKDKAAWNGTAWQEDSYSAGYSNELKIYNNLLESLSGSSAYQSEVNIENVTAIKALRTALEGKLDTYKSMPTPSASYKDMVVLYAGTTTVEFITGRVYQCVEESDIYKWKSLSSSINCDNVTIEQNDQGNIQVKNGGIGEIKLSSDLKEELFKVTQETDGTVTFSSFN